MLRQDVALVAYKAFSDIAGKGAFFLITIMAARQLSQEEFGVFSLATTTGWIAAVVTDFGMQLHLARAVAHRPADARRLLRVWLPIRLCTAAIALLAIAVALGSSGWPVFILAFVYIVSGLIEFLNYFYRGLSRSDIEATLTLWQRLGTLACVAAALAWRADVTTLAAAMVLPAVATWAYSARRALGMGEFRSEDTAVSRIDVRSELWRDVLPIGAGIVLSAIYFRIDIFLIERWTGTGAVALYNAVFRLVEALRLFPAAVLAVALPRLCRAENRRPLLHVAGVVTASAVAVAVALWTSAGWLVPAVYGTAYVDAVPAFRILLLSFPLMSLNYALTHQLIGWDGHRAYASLCAGALVFNVALNARLIPALSINGAAWTTFWTEALLTIGCVSALWSLDVARKGRLSGAVIGT